MAAQLYQLPIYTLGLVLFLLLCATSTVGYLFGRRSVRGVEVPETEVSGPVVAGIVGILGLVLAFTYGFSLTQHETRRSARVSEANAVGTAFLRASLLPAEAKQLLQSAILEYAGTRIFQLDESGTVGLDRQLQASLKAQAVLWPLALGFSQEHLSPAEKTFLLGAINELLDIHTIRVAVGTERMPFIVILFAVGLAVSAFYLIAFSLGQREKPPTLLLGVHAFVVAATFSLIMDFDQSAAGFVRIDDSSMLTTVADMRETLDLNP
jgi:hypothetical protein